MSAPHGTPASARESGVLRIAVIGGGPTATYALERLDAVLGHADSPRRVELHVFERTGEFGAGQVHSAKQPVTSFLNRITGQVSFAADPAMSPNAWIRPSEERPTLYEWCRRRYASTGAPEFDLRAEDWPRRYMHGLALLEQFDCYADSLTRAGTPVHRHPVQVDDVVDRGGWLEVRAGSTRVAVDRILFATGHPVNDARRDPAQRRLVEFASTHPVRYLSTPYPLEQVLTEDVVDASATVGIHGMGLSAIDVLLHLTEGRGGRFVTNAEGVLRYQPSGREPQSMVAFSDCGLFTFARPVNQKQQDPQGLEHRGRFLTDQSIERRRSARGIDVPAQAVGAANRRRQLDFERDVLPLLVLECAVLYYQVLLGTGAAARLAAAVQPRLREFLLGQEPPSECPWQWLLGPVQQEAAVLVAGGSAPLGDQLFSWEAFVDPVATAPGASAAERRAAVLRFMREDHRNAAQGNLGNPWKAAADGVWRDLRPVIGRAVDFGGLTASSHQRFLSVYLRQHNRLANGAALEAMAKILALIESGLLIADAGPRPQLVLDPGQRDFVVRGTVVEVEHHFEALVAARVHAFDPELALDPLYRNLLRRGLARKWVNRSADGTRFMPGGLHLDPGLHPVCPDGAVDDRLTFLGPPSEGVRFFQLGALRPGQDHHVMRDVLAWVDSLELLPALSEEAR